MKVIKPLTLGILTRSYLMGGKRRFVVSALGFFPLGASVQRFSMESEQWAGALAALAGQGIALPLDEVLPKPRAEFLVAGDACAPHGRPVERMLVSASVAGIDKTLAVIGERAWRYDPWLSVDAPRPFLSMPLGYANAFGGPHHRDNPLGRGFDRNRFAACFGTNTRPMPNVERPEQPVRRHWVRYAPAGFGPLAFEWPQRARYAGRYGKQWLAQEAPGFSSSASPHLFQRAPADQWLDGFWQGGEPYRLAGLHPHEPAIVGNVPPLAARAFVKRRDTAAIEPLTLAFDTLWFFPGRKLGVALYHGETPHEHPLGFDIEAVMVAYEHRDRTRPLAHYADVFARRTDPAVAMAHLFNESELAADYDEPTTAARAQAAAGREVAAAAARAARLAAQLAEFPCAGKPGAATADVARATRSPPLRVPDRAALAESDFDLGETLASAQALIVQARVQADAVRAALPVPARARAQPDLTARRETAFARASEPAFDLVAPDEISGGGQTQPGGLATPASGVGKLDAQLAKQAAQQRAARRARVRYVDPDGLLPRELARWLGEQVGQWHRAGVLLAGRDLSGIDLSGFDLSGADLREAQLENADLRHARLIGARLDHTVLTGTRLDGADLSHASLFDANLSHSSAAGTRFAGADMRKVWAIEARWPGADLSDARLDHCLAPGIDLSGACLRRLSATQPMLLDARASASDWREAALSAALLMRATLDGANFAQATLRKAVLVGAKLGGASFEAATLVDVVASGADADWTRVRAAGARAEHCSWQQASLRDSDWRGSTLAACDFGRADLSRAALSDGTFETCLFTGASLKGALAERADLFRAVLRAADLGDAKFTEANLYQADLSDALLAGADFSGARWEPGRRAAA